MSKNILILSGSTRKGGNSDLLCDQFQKGALEGGHAAEKIYISDLNIAYCTGCYACEKSGVCVIKDDMTAVLDKMQAADVIVLATPVYFYTMSAQLKTVIDRTVSRYMAISNKEFYFIATAAEKKSMIERTIDGLRGFTDCLPGAVVKGVVYGEGAWKIGEIKGTKAMQEAFEMGKNA